MLNGEHILVLKPLLLPPFGSRIASKHSAYNGERQLSMCQTLRSNKQTTNQVSTTTNTHTLLTAFASVAAWCSCDTYYSLLFLFILRISRVFCWICSLLIWVQETKDKHHEKSDSNSQEDTSCSHAMEGGVDRP